MDDRIALAQEKESVGNQIKEIVENYKNRQKK